MSKTRFYKLPEAVSKDTEDPNKSNNNNNEENNEGNDDDFELMQDVPYSSSSIDRSSIGSIPWADDAIKQNQLDWERVERMLSGKESLPTEPDLRNEILEWQNKFPVLLNGKVYSDFSKNNLPEIKCNSSKSSESRRHNLVDDLISHLSLNSSDDDDRYDELATPTAGNQIFDSFNDKLCTSNQKKSYIDRLSAKMSLLRIAAIPLGPTKRNDVMKLIPQQTSLQREHSGTTNSLQLHKLSPSRPQPPKRSPKQQTYYKDRLFESQQRLYMPPILNVLESKRRFRDLTSNKSFVQLTNVKPQHAKSAAIIRQPDNNLQIKLQTRPAPVYTGHHQAVWQKPLIVRRVSSNFFNSRNAIILPSLNTQRISAQQRHNSKTSSTEAGTRTHSLSNTNTGSSPSSSANINLRPQYGADRFVSRWQQINAHHTSTSTGTISTGRSISAAVHHRRPHAGFKELFVPYNAYKHEDFK